MEIKLIFVQDHFNMKMLTLIQIGFLSGPSNSGIQNSEYWTDTTFNIQHSAEELKNNYL